MKLSRSLVLLAALAMMTVGGAVAGCGGDDDNRWENETIALGSLFSTTGDGVAFGPQQVKAAQLAVDEINEDEGVNGARLVLTQRDDASDPAISAREMATLIDRENVLAVLGPTFSNSAAVADPVANERETPVLAVSNTGPGIVGDCDYPCGFIFRDSLGEATAIPANIDNFVAREEPDRAWVVFPAGDTFGKTSAGTAASAFRDLGVDVRVSSIGARGITGVRNDRTDVIMITASSGETGSEYLSSLRNTFGYDGPVLGGNAFNSPLVARSAGRDGLGVQSAAAWYAGNTSEENQDFISAYRERYGEAPDQFAAQAYTGVKLLAEAAEDSDLTFDDIAADRRTLRTSLEAVEEETPLGRFRFTPDHDVIQPIWIVTMDGKGGYELVERVDP